MQSLPTDTNPKSRFIVRSSSGVSSLNGLMQSVGGAGITNDAFVVHAYMYSRDALRRLISQADLLERLNRPEADFLWRYPGPFRRSDERLWKHFSNLIDIDYDKTSGISTLRVQAFRPEDAKAIAKELLRSSEDLINRLSERAQGDSVSVASREVEISRLNAQAAVNAITDFRRRHRVIDPGRISSSALDTITQLALEIAKTKAQLTELTSSSPDSPQASSLRLRISALADQVSEERHALAGSDQSLAPLLADYEMLSLNRDFAERTFSSAQSALEVARVEASRQQLFLETISAPSAPDYPKYPQRLLDFFCVLFLTGLVYALGRKLGLDVHAHTGSEGPWCKEASKCLGRFLIAHCRSGTERLMMEMR